MSFPDTLNRRDIARLLGVSERSVTNYQKMDPPIPTHRKKGGSSVLYPAAQCVRWFLELKVAEATQDRAVSELDMAKQRKESAGARKLELEVALMEQSQMPTELHEQRLAARCHELAGRVKGLNGWVHRIRSADTEEAADAIAAEMEDHLLKALQDLADEIPDDDVEGPDGDGGNALAA